MIAAARAPRGAPTRMTGGGDTVEETTGPTLQDIVDTVGVVSVLTAPHGLDRDINDVVLLDVAAPDEAVGKGDIVLALGAAPGRADTAELLDRLSAGGAAAIVLRTDEALPETLVHRAESGDVALLTVARDVSWAQLHLLLRTVVSGVRQAPPRVEAGLQLGDLFGFANAVAAMVGAAVTIEDPSSRVLAFSNTDHVIDEARRATILGRAVPEGYGTSDVIRQALRRIAAEEEPVLLPAWNDVRTRMAIGVRAAGELLGSIWLVEGDEPFTAEQAQLLSQAGRLAAMHLIRARSSDDLERHRRGELLKAVLEGRRPARGLATELGLGEDDPVCVIAFEVFPPSADDADRAVTAFRVVDLLSMHFASYRRPAAVVATGRTVLALVSAAGTARDLMPLADDLTARISAATRQPVRAAVGTVVAGIGDVSRSLTDAEAALDVSDRTRSVVTADDARGRIVLARLSDLVGCNDDLARGEVANLVALDRQKGTTHAATLLAFLDHMGDVRAAATELAVHPNTFRYRLKRVQELIALDLDDPADRLVAHLQLKALLA